jgi:hypothetical protein
VIQFDVVDIISDPLIGLRFVPNVFKAGKLDRCEDVGLDGGSSEVRFRAKVRGTPLIAMCLWS